MSLETGKQLRDAGITLACQAKTALLRECREHLKLVARSRFSREASADDAAEYCVQRGLGEHALGNAAGGLFRGGEWVWTGRWIKSTRDHAHANDLRVWRLRAGF